jgi:hypothetical protein
MLQVTLPDDEFQQTLADGLLVEEKLRSIAATLPSVSDALSLERDALEAAAPAAALILATEQAEADGLHLVDVVNHLNRGQQLVTDEDDRIRFSQLNCLAALRVKDTTAFRNALTFTLYGTIFLGAPREILSYAEVAMTPANVRLNKSGITTVGAPLSVGTGKEPKHDSHESSDDLDGSSLTSGSSNESRALRHGAASVEEGALGIVPRSDQDYDTALRSTVWITVGQRLLALRLYLLRLELEYFIGNQSEGDEFMKVAMSRSIDGVERARLLGTIHPITDAY